MINPFTQNRLVLLAILIPIIIAGCATTNCDNSISKAVARTQLSDMSFVSSFYENNYSDLSEGQRNEILKIASGMAVSAAVSGVPPVDELIALQKQGVVWLIKNKEHLSALLDEQSFRLIVTVYDPMAKEIIRAEKNAKSKIFKE